jgi:hypothetical protein
VKCTELDNKGNIIITTEFGKIIHKRPSAYQRKSNKIDVRFKKLSKNSYTFNIGKYNKTEKLIIDPLVLLYSTYLGGSGNEGGYGITVDANGCTYITGSTDSTDFPLQNPYMNHTGDNYCDVFITKLSADGQSLIFSTYLGGTNWDLVYGIAVDPSGAVYVTGQTFSTDFPCQNAYQGSNAGWTDVFLTKLSADGQFLLYSTYLGGSRDDEGCAIAVDSSGAAYVTGLTGSTNFPLKNHIMGYQWSDDVFVTKLSTDGQSLIYSTYLGGNGSDLGYGITVDANECAYITGYTESQDFPLKNPYMSYRGSNDHNDLDVFVTKLSTDGQSLVYSTYLGGNSHDYGTGIAVDANGCAYITGETRSTDFPIQNPYMSYPEDNDSNAFVTKLSADGQSLIYSTYIGGSDNDWGWKIAVDANGCAYVIGTTWSTDFPLQAPYMRDPGDNYCDAFFTKFSTDGQSLDYSTYLGGSFYDYGGGIAVDAKGGAYITGETMSEDFHIKNSIMSYQWCGDAFVAVFKPIVLNISGARKTERAWIINKDYAELSLLVENPSQVNVSKYVIYKKIDDGTYETLFEISDSSLILGSYSYIDKFLNKDKTYTYKFIAYDSSNNIIAISNKTSI